MGLGTGTPSTTILTPGSLNDCQSPKKFCKKVGEQQGVFAHPKYVMRITGDSTEGKAELDNFIDPESRFPVIATTSDLMTTGVDARTCKLIVLDKTINSMTTFKQIIGRGTRILEEYNKFFFTIMDFKKATTLFNDPDFDGEPVVIYEPGDDDVDPVPPDPGEDTDDEDDDEGKTGGGEQKFHVGGLPVRIIAERVEYVGPDGKLITESYREFAKKQVQKEFASRTR
jgi:type I restriction enzyme, R subunit